MKFRPLRPWVQGNGSVTPYNRGLKPCVDNGAFIALDVATDLYLAATIDSGNLYDSWHNNQKFTR
jgi:hypothetical protein